MKLHWIFFILFLSSLTSIAYAHSDLSGVAVQNQDGLILYEREFGTTEKDEPEPTKVFTSKWFYHNFILILSSGIIVIMSVVGGITYREDISPRISKFTKHS